MLGKHALRNDKFAAGKFVATLNLLGFENLDMEGQRMTNLSEHIDGLKTVGAEVIQVSIDRRLALIADKNWAEADRIRDELLEQGIQLKDGKDPDTGERVTTWEVKR